MIPNFTQPLVPPREPWAGHSAAGTTWGALGRSLSCWYHLGLLGQVTQPPETIYRVSGMEVMVFFSGVVARVNGLLID